ncbi:MULTISPECIES: phage tail tip lysozyme [unclassified Psychrobacter]|uniref:phage tail tip lysozyme n=1 Tax=unclassified Psychrobacter TaxID=196806 RepID=UPI0018F49591|nr:MULTISPECIES: phage tail tip lysozyme [unclassified Psychrobacter]
MERYLNYDSAGFIVGMNRVKDSIDNVHDDTQSIIALMSAQAQIGQTQLAEISKRLSEANHHHRAAGRRQTRANRIIASGAIDASASAGTSERRTRRSPVARINNQSSDPQQAQRRNADTKARRARIVSSQDLNPESDERSGSPARRDSRGRFVSDNSSAGGSESERRLNAMARNIANDMRLGVNSGGVDPMLDSMRELGTAMSPLGRAGKLALRGAKFSMSKFRAIKRREPLPQDQDRHNQANEKLLDKIWKAIRKSEGSGGGLLGGLLGGGGRNRGGRAGRGGGRVSKLKNLAGRGLRAVGGMRGLGWLAGAAGAASLAMDWDSLNHKEKSAGVGSLVGGGGGAMAGAATGAMIGSVVPVVGTAVGGAVGMVVGGWLGSEGGEALGAAASPYIDSWTSSLVAYNLPKKMTTAWETGTEPFFTKLSGVADSMQSWFAGKWNATKDFFGFGGDGEAAPSGTAANAADFAIGNAATVSLGACAKYVNDAFRANGLKASGHGKDVAKNLAALNQGKFEQVAYDENYVPKIGDVMSMPSSKNSKHNYGHAAIYTSQGWVSDFKQGNKYGNTGAPNADYYQDIQSGRIKPTVVRMREQNPAALSGAVGTGAVEAVNYFMSRGYTKEQAIGIAANIQQESGFNHKAYNSAGGGNGARGLAQWRGQRQKNFKKRYGVSLENSTKEQQYDFIDYELKTTHKAAGDALKKAKTIGQATKAILEQYERPSNTAAEMPKRMENAEQIKRRIPTIPEAAKKKNGILGFSTNQLTSSMALASTGIRGGQLPVTRPPTIPPMPTITQRIDSGSAQKPIILQASNDTIPQNVSDRGIAHAVTGGLGQDRYWG